jgi:hypothetical protein
MRSLVVPFASILLTVVATGCGTNGSDYPPVPETTWKQAGTWSGRGNQQLETFDMPRVTWRVRWEVRGASPDRPGALRVAVHSANSGRLVTELADVKDIRGPDGDVSYVTDMPHRYYLVVTSNGVDWTLTVEEPVLPE